MAGVAGVKGGVYGCLEKCTLLTDKSRFPAGSVLPLEGVAIQAIPFLVAEMRREGNPALLVVTGGTKAQELFHQDLISWCSLEQKIKLSMPDYFPSWGVLPLENRLPQVDTLGDRLGTILDLNREGQGACVVAQVESILEKTFSVSNFKNRLRSLQTKNTADPLELLDWLEAQGYDSVAKVAQKGEFAVRGGIVDIYPLSAAWPVRLEFFGNEVDSIREFDPNTQLSRGPLERVLIPPAGEMGLLKRQVESLAPGETVDSVATCVANYLPPDTVLVIPDPGLVWENLNLFRAQADWSSLIQEWEFFVSEFLKRGGRILLVGDCDVLDLRNLVGEAPILERMEMPIEIPEMFCPMPVNGTLEMLDAYRTQLFHQVERWGKEGYSCYFTYANDGENVRIQELWSDVMLGRHPPRLLHAAISKGVVIPEQKFALLTDNDIFCRRKVQRSRRLRKEQAAATRSQLEIDFDHIEEGDLVVHLQKGIAKYRGIGRIPQRVGRKDLTTTDSPECLILEFGADDPFGKPPLLYVPVTEAHLVNKYIGVGKSRPPLSRLGGKKWDTARAEARKAVADIAGDLLHVQAQREAEKGFVFPTDTEWQHTFENAFEYEETPDQLRAIEATKQDMESPRPMDRLVCGDVGFGKTEVAIRAAFKAVMAGKQVALLAPTTVLVQQHYNTFRERMAGYPFQIETISRFKNKTKQGEILARLATGGIDIIIGTHRLVQSDVQFKDLGLFIIDEEQRFGVKQKERIKKIKALTDVLTLTATPIPRTLYMALSGVKSMSSIETPPQERLPVKTVVCQYDERVIREAIQRELNRQGQVFFLHNRVTTIEAMERKLHELVPQAKIAVGHGQMSSDELEKIMSNFVNGQVDILLSTTIIESGLDIPNANTIIIDRADRFGLSELYQLRGRVGRYRNQAYAYLLIPRHAALLADARKRISAIKQYSRLGSGFKIAMRDLEIRGAGNILGSEQSGHISAIGFDLYCKLLQKSISQLRGEKPVPHCDTKVKLDFLNEKADPDEDGEREFSPHQNYLQLSIHYIEDSVQRLEIYRRLAQTRTIAEVNALAKEMVDRFGKYPIGVQYLLEMYRIRAVAGQKGINSIETENNRIIITRNGVPIMVRNHYPQFTKKTKKGRLKELFNLVQFLSDGAVK